MMKAAVTGGTGFLGSHLVEILLDKGYEVRALARKTSDISLLETTGAEIVIGDIEDYDSLRPLTSGADLVFHAAAKVMPGWGKWQEFESCIVKGTENMLNASIEAGVSRFLYVSSEDVYGKGMTGETPADESTPTEVEFTPYTYYCYAKLLADRMAREYHEQGKLPVTVVRMCSLYGPRDRLLTDRFFSLVNSPIVIWPGRSNSRTTLGFATDVAECAILAATSERAAGQVYNVAPHDGQRWGDLADALARALGKSERRWSIPMSPVYATAFLMEVWAKLWRFKEPPFLTRADLRLFEEGMYLDGSKAKKELEWEPRVSLEEGAKRYVEWRRSQGKR
jgi:nucleoside-diphosphate-sugar epimerase